ncbi:ERF family protein [uncultured Pediococcus sp.]|uniref:ERF family protein n=1 Tax=uncultured Pediococcus sp. TaxID=165192 RepID=UPI00259BAC35|nr:ERF family protein [uncultured Pediococcus sp.]
MSTNIYQKLNNVKRKLRNTKIKKGGRNDYSKFDYMELTDFEGYLDQYCEEEGVNTYFNWDNDKATLVITNVENLNETLKIEAPLVECGIKGASAIQNLGGVMTYMRRYLFTSTFGIAEHDVIDALADNQKDSGEYKKDMKLREATTTAMDELREGKKAWAMLVKTCGYKTTEPASSENNQNATAKAKEWEKETFGSVISPLDLKAEHIKLIEQYCTGPETFVSDEIA